MTETMADLDCSFCQKPVMDPDTLCRGDESAVCDACVVRLQSAFDRTKDIQPGFACTFCGRLASTRADAPTEQRVIAGPVCYICHACIQLCSEILAEDGV